MGLSVKVYRDFHQLDESIVDFWKRHQWHPYGDIDYVKNEYADRMEDWSPYVAVVKEQRDIVSCVIGRIQSLPLTLQFGYKRFRGPSLTTLTVDLSGFIANGEATLHDFFLERWSDLLASRRIEAVLLRAIPQDSPLQKHARLRFPFFRRGQFPIVQQYWLLEELNSFEGFLRTHRTLKRNFRTYSNRLERAFGGKLELRCYRNLVDIELMLDHSEEVSKKTWQRKFGEPSFLSHEERSRYSFYFRKGWCRGYVLYLDHVPVAYRHGIVYGDTFYVGRTGYDPLYRNLGVGTYLLMNIIRDFCGTSTIQRLDFNVGNSEDKRQYCDSSFEVSDVHLFGPGMRLWVPILLRLAAQGSHELAKSISHRGGFYQSIRKRWRHQ